MAHEIEADFVTDYHNEDKQCQMCSSYNDGFCSELGTQVPENAHCDFFQSVN